MRESDIPGWLDEDISITTTCECGWSGVTDAIQNPDGIFWSCPACDKEHEDDLPEPDYGY